MNVETLSHTQSAPCVEAAASAPCDIMWYRKDLRTHDNEALCLASKGCVVCVYVLHPEVLKVQSAQSAWLISCLENLHKDLIARGSFLHVVISEDPATAIGQLAETYQSSCVYVNKGCTHDSASEEHEVLKALPVSTRLKICGHGFVVDPTQVLTKQGTPFRVFTPFFEEWKKRMPAYQACSLPPCVFSPSSPTVQALLLPAYLPQWSHSMLGHWEASETWARHRMKSYVLEHDYVAARNMATLETSRLSPYLALGVLSLSEVVHLMYSLAADVKAKKIKPAKGVTVPMCLNNIDAMIRQCAWSEFAAYLWWHTEEFPFEDWAHKRIVWEQIDPVALKRWTKGQTGIPFVDAGMRELWQTGYMHNRVRMVVADFLCKHLGYDWKEGAKWFHHTLIDADVANNALGWQWASGTGPDAAPYHRVFNPTLQAQKCDPTGAYRKKWLPEIAHLDGKELDEPWKVAGHGYPQPLVIPSVGREKALLRAKLAQQLSAAS